MIENNGIYYLYRHIRLDKNEPFYIGVGSKEYKKRKDGLDRAYSKSGRTKYWKNIVNINPNYEIEILLESNDYNFILQKEIEFVALYGRKDKNLGSLVNMTDGGQGVLGRKYKHSLETKEKLSKANTGRKLSQETKDKIGKFHKGRISPMKGRKQTQKALDALLKANTGRKWTISQREKYILSKKGKIQPESAYKWRYKKIIQYDLNNNFIRDWDNIRDAAKIYRVGVGEISITCKANAGEYPIGHKSYNRKTCRGFIWKYRK